MLSCCLINRVKSPITSDAIFSVLSRTESLARLAGETITLIILRQDCCMWLYLEQSKNQLSRQSTLLGYVAARLNIFDSHCSLPSSTVENSLEDLFQKTLVGDHQPVLPFLLIWEALCRPQRRRSKYYLHRQLNYVTRELCYGRRGVG